MAFAVLNQPIGISTALSSASSLCAAPVLGSDAVTSNAYWIKHPFKWDGGMLFLVGTFLGSLISVLASRTFRVVLVDEQHGTGLGEDNAPAKEVQYAGRKTSVKL